MKKLLCLVMSVALLLGATGCNMNNTGKGAAIGAGGGAAVGAGL
ncbi:MAG: OmpA family protein, partial [Bacteroidales bacterium]|nr:OmpA family protein [Bacteroidales bacterium]